MTDRTKTNGNPEVLEKAKRRRFDASYSFVSWRKRSDAANLSRWASCFVGRVCIRPI